MRMRPINSSGVRQELGGRLYPLHLRYCSSLMSHLDSIWKHRGVHLLRRSIWFQRNHMHLIVNFIHVPILNIMFQFFGVNVLFSGLDCSFHLIQICVGYPVLLLYMLPYCFTWIDRGSLAKVIPVTIFLLIDMLFYGFTWMKLYLFIRVHKWIWSIF